MHTDMDSTDPGTGRETNDQVASMEAGIFRAWWGAFHIATAARRQ
jgi:hypothetical protein